MSKIEPISLNGSYDSLEDLFCAWKEAHASETDYEETTVRKPLWNRRKPDENTYYEKIEEDGRYKYPGIEQSSFVSDGYIDKDEYKNAETKVLFILKEANIQAYRKDGEKPSERKQYNFYTDYIEKGDSYWDGNKKIQILNRPKQQEKMAKIAHYIFTGKKEDLSDNNSDSRNSLKKVAFMNLNKRGGANIEQKVRNYTEKYINYINKQIDILNPDVIIVIGKTLERYFKELIPVGEKRVVLLNHTADIYHKTYKVEDYVNDFIDKYNKI